MNDIFPSQLAQSLFTILCYVFFIVEMYFVLKTRKGAKSKDKGSGIYMFVVLFITFSLMNVLLNRGIGVIPTELHWLTWVGFVIFIAGESFRLYAIRVLGKFFTGRVLIHEDHQIIQNGPYRILRHPSYTGAIIAFLGVALATNDWIVYLLFIVAITAIYSYRISIEEQALLDHFGDKYRQYQQRTWRIIPFIY